MADSEPSHDTKVHPGEKAKDAGEKPAVKGGWIEHHKPLAYGGMALILIVLYLFMRSKGSGSGSAAAASQPTATGASVDPATGYEYGSPADMAALSGSGSVTATPGATGPAGPTGPAGASGSAGPNASAQGLTPITFAQAQALSNGTERPYVMNASGTGFAPAAAGSVKSGITYWAGPMEEQQILGKTGPFASKPPAKTTKK